MATNEGGRGNAPQEPKDSEKTQREQGKDALWSMSAVSQETGIGQHTLRAWERRFGFPNPLRLPSGHRRYTREQVEHLSLIAQALKQSHRAGDVVPLPLEDLKRLLGITAIPTTTKKQDAWIEEILEKTRRFDGESIMQELLQSAASMGARDFLRLRLEPLLIEVGEAWAQGEIDVRHEHFLSELLEDLLRFLRVPLEANLKTRPILLGGLQGEHHTLGLQMVALTASLVGQRSRVLGPDTPLEDMIASIHSVQPLAVGISVSVCSVNREMEAMLNDLHERSPSYIPIWVGGSGARALGNLHKDIKIMRSLNELEEHIASLESR